MPQGVVVRISGKPTPTLAYAVERIVAELQTVHGLNAHGETEAPRQAAIDGQGVVTLCRTVVAGQPQETGSNPTALPPDGFRITVQPTPLRVAIVAASDIGLWYGACAWLDSLDNTANGTVLTPVGEFSGHSALALRFTRGLTPGDRISRIEDAIPALDWWARWRMNVTVASQYPGPLLQEYLAEAHKRGIRVLRGLGVRNLCAADDQAVAECAGEFRRFLQQGGDGVSLLWDDLPHERCRGHCQRCIERFGTNSLPHEIVRVLDALCDVAAQSQANPLIVWCPSHYSENRYPEMSDESFFRVIGASRPIRKQTHMYHCEFAPDKTAILERFGITNRVWWYNGMRTVYHVCRNWPDSPEWKLDIPGVKSFGAPDFARFEVGWKTGIGVREDGAVIPVPDRTWENLRTLSLRFQGCYPCMDQHPYHAAVSGLFALSPRTFDQREADRVVFRAMFGPGSAAVARNWSDAYVHLQVRLAQTAHRSPGNAQAADLERALAPWEGLAREVRTRADRGRSLLPATILESVLSRMDQAGAAVRKMLSQPDRLPPNAPTATARSNDTLVVMTWNIRSASPGSPVPWPSRRPLLRECIQSVSPDVIGTQEGYYQQLNDIAVDLPEYGWIGQSRTGGSRGEFMAVFYRKSRLEPVAFDHFWLSDTPETIGSKTWGNPVPRMLVWVRFLDRLTGSEFHLATTHVDGNKNAQARSARLIRERLEALDPAVPLLLTGDFNAVPGRDRLHELLVGEDLFADTWLAAKERRGDGWSTFTGFKELVKNERRIDWILARGSVAVDASEIVTWNRAGKFPSDHLPVVAWLRLP
ncbi:MAG TPA: endonuclease/exonuclease/phosphatase family protein [Candidatus Paceibacterota bacterium]|nr:endonuclease/exonuclease/phosphatase family protein [Verrucomicrobiota bacterium]HRZ46358.1 endonuclease/exonuclease/phosphatase family protein [Candidatus Paceibacterota bacterium]HRZ92630.1 endonuclease/exonuclease/phosphatase family protein [Candidatus Paceibacterota bacterium]